MLSPRKQKSWPKVAERPFDSQLEPGHLTNIQPIANAKSKETKELAKGGRKTI